MHIDQAIAGLKAESLSRDEFLHELSTATLDVPLIHTDQGNTLWTFQANNMTCGGVFTTDEHMNESGAPIEGYVELTGAQLAEQWPPELVVFLNPGTADADLMIPGSEIARMADGNLGNTERVAKAGTSIRVGAPPTPPAPEYVDAAQGLVNAFGDIEACYLFQAMVGDNPADLVLGVALKPGIDPAQLMPHAADWITKHLPGGRGIDMLPLSPSLQESVAEYVPAITAGTAP